MQHNSKGEKPAGNSGATAIALVSALIACCSLFLTIDQARLNRLDKKLSVRPDVEISLLFLEDWNGWAVKNNGVGPARVVWFEVAVDGVPKKNWLEVKSALPLPPGEFMFSNPYPNTILPVGSRASLFGFKGRYPHLQILKQNVGRVKMSMCYCSLYEECWRVGTTSTARETDSCKTPPSEPFSPATPL